MVSRISAINSTRFVRRCFFLPGEWLKTFWDYIFSSWAVLSDEQMRKRWPFSLLNDEQMSNKVGVEHQPGRQTFFFRVQDG